MDGFPVSGMPKCPERFDSSGQISPIKVKHLLPAVDSGLYPIDGTIGPEKGVSGVIVRMEFVGLAEPLESLLCFRHIGLGRSRVIFSEETQQRARDASSLIQSGEQRRMQKENYERSYILWSWAPT